jgi:hypothetical protein
MLLCFAERVQPNSYWHVTHHVRALEIFQPGTTHQMAAPDNLVVAVIGIPYDATADDVRGVFAGCGTMSAFDMPTFEVRGGAVHARARVCTHPS